MHRLTPAGLLPVLLAVPGVAQSPPIVTEAEFLSALDASHPAVAGSGEALALAQAQAVEAATVENPLLGIAREDPSGPVAQTDWTISWQPPGARRRPEIGAREKAVEAAAARLSHRLLTLRLAMREVYAGWALAAAREERLAAQAARVEALAERQAVRAARGESSGLEADRLALAAAALRSRVALAAAAAARARGEATGWYPAMPPEARPVLPALPPAPGLDAPHPLVRAAEADVAAALLERRAADRFVASPQLSLGWQRQESGQRPIDGPTFGLTWALPLFDRNRAARAASEARVTGARARLERMRREVDAARAAAREAFARLAAALDDAAGALAANERMLDSAEAAFRAGEASLTDLLDTHRSVTEGKLAVLDLHEAALAAHRRLVRLAGASPESLSQTPAPEDRGPSGPQAQCRASPGEPCGLSRLGTDGGDRSLPSRLLAGADAPAVDPAQATPQEHQP